jgi:hypothetical protein
MTPARHYKYIESLHYEAKPNSFCVREQLFPVLKNIVRVFRESSTFAMLRGRLLLSIPSSTHLEIKPHN